MVAGVGFDASVGRRGLREWPGMFGGVAEERDAEAALEGATKAYGSA